jgi:RNA polymerase sigma factor (sigma-70 family)
LLKRGKIPPESATAAEPRTDPLLLPYLEAPEGAEGEAAADALLGQLVAADAEPILRPIVRYRLGSAGAEAEDLAGEILLRLVERLKRLRREPRGRTIADFRSYVAVVAHHACAEQLRRSREGGAGREPWAAGSEDDLLAGLPDPGPGAAVALARQDALRALWVEIQALPPRQSAALLLNLRDRQGRDAVALLPLTGTASLREIARALGMAPEVFAGLWNQLPLDDRAIAGLLGVTRQQVINLRKSARERLARRLKGLG